MRAILVSILTMLFAVGAIGQQIKPYAHERFDQLVKSVQDLGESAYISMIFDKVDPKTEAGLKNKGLIVMAVNAKLKLKMKQFKRNYNLFEESVPESLLSKSSGEEVLSIESQTRGIKTKLKGGVLHMPFFVRMQRANFSDVAAEVVFLKSSVGEIMGVMIVHHKSKRELQKEALTIVKAPDKKTVDVEIIPCLGLQTCLLDLSIRRGLTQ